MLILSRREGEMIILSAPETLEKIATVTVTEIRGSSVKFKIEAMPGVLIDQYTTQHHHLQRLLPHDVIALSHHQSGDVISRIHHQGAKGNQVRIGCEASLDVDIDRLEIYERKLREAEQNELLLSA
jgi:sRNA-binding carbon storage regulator CsrA